MIKLKNILQSKYIFFILLLITIISSLIRINLKKVDIETPFEGILENYTIDGNKLSFILKNKYSLKCTYYIKDASELKTLKKLNLGISLRVEGNIDNPKSNTIPNTFNYKKYLKSKNIYKVMSVENYKVINYKTNIIYTIKNKIVKQIDKYKSKRYINAFILGDKKYLDDEIKNRYQELGVSHIFAISGMHVSLITGILFFILKKIKDNLKYFIVISFLIIYVFLTGLQASVLRSVSFFIVNYLNKKYSFDLDIKNVFLIAMIILLIIYPNLIIDIGFQYSSIISFSLINFSYLIKGNYLKTSLAISIIAFLVSLPITINNNFEINILSIINNLFIVPYISYILYPLSILTFFIPIFDNLLFIFCNLIEVISSHLLVLNIIIPRMNIITIIIYYLCLYIFFKTYKKIYLIFILCLILIIKCFYIIDPSYYIYYLDVSQGDSSLIRYRNEVVLIDTGGSVSFKEDEWKKKKEYHISDSTITFLKSIGVSKLNYLVLTHGDADHMGEAVNLVENFKVEKVILNCGESNNLEKELIKILDKKQIKYNFCIKELKVSNNKLYFLQTGVYDNENDNSNVIYTKLNGYKFMFMGDAGVNKEKDILDKYNILNIDVLKVGHHGSKTSSSKEFIDSIKPKYSIISVGKNNRYGHPNEEVLTNLNDSKIYRTDQNGTIMLKIKNNKFNIETCSSQKGVEMNYYNEIKNKLIDNEIYSKVKDYSKERHKVITYFEVGKLLDEAGSRYGDNILNDYSNRLVVDLGKKYNERTLRRIRQYYRMFKDEKWSPLATKLSWSHYTELLSIKDSNKLAYYINIAINNNLSKRELREKIKSKEYERMPIETKNKLVFDDKIEIKDLIPNPILIRNKNNIEIVTEKALHNLILEDIESFMKELGSSFSYIGSEYKIKIADRNNYIDLLLFNIRFNCYVVVELKVTEFKAEYISQVQKYMNYIDKNIKEMSNNNTMGILICKRENRFVIEYCSDERIAVREYEFV